MIIECSHCQAKYKYPEERFGDSKTKKVKCSKCQETFEIQNPSSQKDATGQIVSKTRRIEGAKNEGLTPEDAALRGLPMLPDDRHFSVSILDGEDAGRIFKIEKPTVTLGRSNADLVLNDPEASRLHAQVEIQGRKYVLRDMGSTNGTFSDNKRLHEEVEIQNLSEFRVGSTNLMFIETEVEK